MFSFSFAYQDPQTTVGAAGEGQAMQHQNAYSLCLKVCNFAHLWAVTSSHPRLQHCEYSARCRLPSYLSLIHPDLPTCDRWDTKEEFTRNRILKNSQKKKIKSLIPLLCWRTHSGHIFQDWFRIPSLFWKHSQQKIPGQYTWHKFREVG